MVDFTRLTRAEIEKLLGGNPKLVKAYEQLQKAILESLPVAVAQAQADATQAISDAADAAADAAAASAAAAAAQADADAIETDPIVGDLLALTDPNADRILFWDDSAGDVTWLRANTGLAISGTDLNCTVTTSGYEGGPPTPPTDSDLGTWDNQGTSTNTDGTGAMDLKFQVDGVLHGKYKAAPSTPYDVYCRVEVGAISTAAITANVQVHAGILFKDTGGDNERVVFGVLWERISGDEQNTYAAYCLRWSGASPPVIGTGPLLKYTGDMWKWVKVNNDGTTLTFYVSKDGKNWLTVGTELLSAHIDAAASYGVGGYAVANATEAHAWFSYFSTTPPA